MGVTMSLQAASVLVVDDDPAFRQGLRTSLRTSGYSTDAVRSAEEAIAYVRERPVDIVLLDINMPGLDGVEACRRIRAVAPQTAIVMVTVRDAEDDKVVALEAGADDYVSKPFHLRELKARLRALLRRTGAEGAPLAPILRAGDLEIELERRTLRKAGRRIHLSPKEFDLLGFLMQHKNIPVMHARILRTIWGPEYGNESEYLRSYIKALRRKIEDDPAHPQYIVTEPWLGYRFRDPADRDAALAPDADDPESTS
jgi:two-component system, OmpR family, KDP operon response regulator KdpE